MYNFYSLLVLLNVLTSHSFLFLHKHWNFYSPSQIFTHMEANFIGLKCCINFWLRAEIGYGKAQLLVWKRVEQVSRFGLYIPTKTVGDYLYFLYPFVYKVVTRGKIVPPRHHKELVHA